jgi:hypothetical protein
MKGKSWAAHRHPYSNARIQLNFCSIGPVPLSMERRVVQAFTPSRVSRPTDSLTDFAHIISCLLFPIPSLSLTLTDFICGGSVYCVNLIHNLPFLLFH